MDKTKYLISKSIQTLYTFPFHSHPRWEIVVSLQGEGTMYIEGREYPFRKGTIFCIPPGMEHRKKAKNGFIDGCIMLQEGLGCFDGQLSVFGDDGQYHCCSLVSIAYELYLADEGEARPIVDSAVSMISYLLSRQKKNRSDSCPEAVRLQEILLSNLSNPYFSLSEAVEQSGYSGTYIRKLFKRQYGISPSTYLQHIRMEHAKNLLMQYAGKISVKEVAYQAGYEDPLYFSRKFRQYTSVSPREYGKISCGQ